MSHKLLVRRAAVLGAGVMGAQIAAHLTNAGVDTVLFDLPAKEGDPNGVVLKAIANLGKLSPAPLASKALAEAIAPANYDDGLEQLHGLRPDHRGDRRADGLEAGPVPEDRAVRAGARRAGLQHLRPGHQRAGRRCCRRKCATASAACTSSTRRATCTWPS